ncbi:AAA family ATPase [Patescibacteria group bacterium]|nr:AAA family ATPase [Patescibacteria group bacterium]
MLVGHKDKVDIFKKLIESNGLAHGYLLFGESSVGKFLFAKSLANFLENHQFEEPEHPLKEVLILAPEDGSIGINPIRDAKQFLSRKPVLSSRRVLIIDEAEAMTNQAQNAVLKLAEEPPENSLIIIITSGLEAILPTLKSRLQKIYFLRLKSSEIEKLLLKKYGLSAPKAKSLAESSFGKPGLAVRSLDNNVAKEAEKLADNLFKNPSEKRKIIEAVAKDGQLMNEFLIKVITRLSRDPIKNVQVLSKIMDRMVKMSDFTTNKRLQLESALWNI